MDKFLKGKVRTTAEQIKKLSQNTLLEIQELKFIASEYKKDREVPVPDDSWKEFKRNDYVSGRDKHFWFSTHISTPAIGENEELVLEVITGHDGDWDATNPQIIVYLNGELVQGLDINHRVIYLNPNSEYDVLLYFYVGMIDSNVGLNLNLKTRNILLNSFYYDLIVPYEAALCFDDDDYNHIRTIKCLEQACNFLDLRDIGSKEFYDSVYKAKEYLQEEFYTKICGNSDVTVNYIGSTHIDVAWLWTLAQTKEKVQRSFSTVLALMERYPNYLFMSSQPQLYSYLKEEEPELYEKVKEKILQGRWEAEGAMWLEADCNLSSGESLVRQIIHGKRFMRDEFGVESKVLWLPDVFGYSAALPQILAKCGVDKFVTSKISWNEMNKMPNDSFMWKGIDGTEIFTYFLTAQDHTSYLSNDKFTTYNGVVTPQMNLGAWERYQQKDYTNEVIVAYGYGDGGGGPTEEMIEYEARLEYGLPGQPKAKMCFVSEFLEKAKKHFEQNAALMGRVPKWVGELYLEYHRGTYTSIAKNKKNNRECEFLCQNTETLSVIGNVLFGDKYPHTVFEKAWKKILLNHFHDIIPGSSIHEVYEDSDKDYAEVRTNVGKIKNKKLIKLAQNVSKPGFMVYNPNSFEVSGYVQTNENRMFAQNVPLMGWKVIEKSDLSRSVTVEDKTIESPHYTIRFNDDMNIVSVYDKDNDREVVEKGKYINAVCAFEDYPANFFFDNWELSNFYKQKKYEILNVESSGIIKGEGYAGFEIKRRYYKSVIVQKIIVYAESRRIDFETYLDWHERHTILKALFPVDVYSTEATYDIQFGNIKRPNHQNTSWDAMKFEVCSHKWMDLSEDDYGVSVLNDCKYGHSVSENEMALTLLRCGTYPDTEADQSEHKFTYSLYPHKGDFKRGETIKEAYLLNRPLEIVETYGEGTLSGEYSFISCDCDNIVVETVKQSEDGSGIVIRLFDTWNKKSEPTLNFGFDAKKIYLCDMLENKTEDLGSGNKIKINVKNYEIVTLLIEY